MTSQSHTNVVSESSVNDNAPTNARGNRGKKPPSVKRPKPKGYSPEIEGLTQKIRKIQGRELEDRVEIGLELSRAKDLLGHGGFRPWLGREFSWSERTATSYMLLARHYEGKTAKFADLNLGTALALVSDPTLEKVREDVFAQANDDKKITREAVRKQITEVKAAAPKRPTKAKMASSSDAQQIETLPATSKSPADEIVEALLNLLSMVDKNKRHCFPDHVAMSFANDERKLIALTNTGSIVFVSEVTNELLRLAEPEVQLKLAR